MTHQTFICRVRGGSEFKALEMAAQRVECAWLPCTLESRRIARRRAYRASVTPLLGYMWVTATPAEREHLLRSQLVHKTLWFLDTDRKLADYARWRAQVEGKFSEAMHAYARNTRSFHNSYKKGQAVRLRQEGMDTFMGKFKAQVVGGPNDGLLEIESEMMGQQVTVYADPFDVAAQ